MQNNKVTKPRLSTLLKEGVRANRSFVHSHIKDDGIVELFPQGNKAPVLVLPGFATTDFITRPLGEFIDSLGFSAKKSKVGVHLGPSDYCIDHWKERLHYLSDKNKAPLSLVGWSLGGIMARELAREFPDRVEQVITLGSPFMIGENLDSTFLHIPVEWATRLDQTIGDISENTKNLAALSLYHVFNETTICDTARDVKDWGIDSIRRLLNAPKATQGDFFLKRAATPITTPSMHIYTEKDGFVNWITCVGEENETSQNFPVNTSHIGLPFHKGVRLIIADLLHKNAGRGDRPWQKFNPDIYEHFHLFPDKRPHEDVYLGPHIDPEHEMDRLLFD